MKDYLRMIDLLPSRLPAPAVSLWTVFALLLPCVLSAYPHPSLTRRQLVVYPESDLGFHPPPPEAHAAEQLWNASLPHHFLNLLWGVGLLSLLQSELQRHSALTVFAPSDDVLVELGKAVEILHLRENAEIAADILLYHFLPCHVEAEDFTTGAEFLLPTLAGQPLFLYRRRRRIYVRDIVHGGDALAAPDYSEPAKQIQVHRINTLLLPKSAHHLICALTLCPLTTHSFGRMRLLQVPSAGSPAPPPVPLPEWTMGATALAELQDVPDRFSPFLTLVSRAGFGPELAAYNGVALTILAPSRGALKAFKSGVVTNETLRYHLLPVYVTVEQLREIDLPAQVPTLLANRMAVFNVTQNNKSSHLTINNAWILKQLFTQSSSNTWKPISIIGISQVLVPPPVVAPAPAPAPEMIPIPAPGPSLAVVPAAAPASGTIPSPAPGPVTSQSAMVSPLAYPLSALGSNYSHFITVLRLTDLDTDIAQFHNPLTILAPSNAAFESLDPALWSRLNGSVANYTSEMFLMALGNMVSGIYTLANLTANPPLSPLVSLHDQKLNVTVNSYQGATNVSIAGSRVLEQILSNGTTSILGTDSIAHWGIFINCSQGWTPEPTANSSNILLKALGESGNHTQLVKHGMDLLNGLENLNSSTFTILAPTDNAFQMMNKDTKAAFAKDKMFVEKVLRWHILYNYFTTNLLLGLAPYNISTLLDNQNVTATGENGVLIFEGYTAASPQPLLSNGRFYILSVDHVLIPSTLLSEMKLLVSTGAGSDHRNFLWPVVGVASGFFVVMCFACCFFIMLRRRQQKIQFSVHQNEDQESRPVRPKTLANDIMMY